MIAKSVNPLKADPTGTSTEQKVLERMIIGRLRSVKGDILKLIAIEDAFGLKGVTRNLASASTQVNITDKQVLVRIVDIQNGIDESDLLKFEDQPHVTVRYGLDDVGPERVEFIAGQHRAPIRLTLGRLSLFSNAKEDVLKIEVTSTDLHAFYHHLGLLPNKKTQQSYIPHLTVAYLKPGTGQKYIGPSGLEDYELTFKSIQYSNLAREHSTIALNALWSFQTDDLKLAAFVDWIKSQMSKKVLAKAQALGQDNIDHWLGKYITDVFTKGMSRSWDYLKKTPGVKLDFYRGGKQEFLRSSFFRPVTIERVKLLITRSLNELEGMTDAIATQVQRTLADGFIRGENPFDIARRINKDVDQIGLKRAQAIARSEVVRAYNEGALEGMELLGVEEVGVMVEWRTSRLGTTKRGNPSPCAICAPLEGVVMPIKKARGLLPRHPSCLCSWIPANVGEDQKDQIRTRSRVKAAIEKSLRAGMPKRTKRTMAEERAKNRWPGARVKITSDVPKGILE